jgi:hypothetical protein
MVILAYAVPGTRRKSITLANRDEKPMTHFYQVDYALSTMVPADAAPLYFHAQFRRDNPLLIRRCSQIRGTASRAKASTLGLHMAWGVHNSGRLVG